MLATMKLIGRGMVAAHLLHLRFTELFVRGFEYYLPTHLPKQRLDTSLNSRTPLPS